MAKLHPNAEDSGAFMSDTHFIEVKMVQFQLASTTILSTLPSCTISQTSF